MGIQIATMYGVLLTNVFFIVEVVRALAEEAGGLETVGVRELPSQVFAGGIQSVIQRRLNRVPDWARPLLRTAAIAGRQIDTVLFRALEPGLDHWLQVSLEASVLEVSDTQWRFAHDKLREALLASMDAAERRRLHLQVGEALERVHGPTDAQAATLAYHFEQAGEWGKAARFASQAGAGSLRRGALHEAVELLTRAAALQQQVGAPPREQAVTLRRLSRALFGVGQPEACVQQVRRAMALLGRPLPKQRGKRMLAIARELGVELRHRILGPPRSADARSREIATELLALTKGTGDALFGRIDEALFVMLISLHAAELIGDVEQQINYMSWLGYAAFAMPIHPVGRAYFGIAEELLAEHPQFWEHSSYQPMCGYYKHAEGKWQQSLSAYTRWLQAVQSSGDSPLQCLALSSRCAAQLQAGRFEDALQDAETCYRAAKRLGNEHYMGGSLGIRALVHLYRGDPVQSAQLFAAALDHMEKSASPIYKLSGVGAASLAALQSGDLELARARADLALRRMRRTQAPAPGFYDGYAAVAEVALHLLLAATSIEERAAAALRMREALYQLARFGLAFPIGRARLFNIAGRLLWHRGERRLALAFLAQAQRSARTYSMQYEQAHAHLWQGRLGSSSDGKRLVSAAHTAASLRMAASIFEALGSRSCADEAEQLRTSR